MRFWLVLLIPITVISCAKKGGGVDGAGGNLIYPSSEKIRETANSVWGLLTRLSPDNPLILAQQRLELGKRTPDQEKIYRMVVKINGLGENVDLKLRRHHSGGENDPFRALHAKKLNFVEQSCMGPFHARAAAAVTQLNMNGEVCVSLPEFRATTVSSLKSALFEILVHEIAHLKGYEEPGAKRIQKYFSDNMPVLLRTTGEVTRLSMLDRFQTVLSYWPYLVRYGWMSQAYVNETLMPWSEFLAFLDSEIINPYINDDVQVAHPELYEKVKESFAQARGEGMTENYGQHPFWYGILKMPRLANEETLSATQETLLKAFAAFRVLSMYYFGESSNDPLIQKTIENQSQWLNEQEAALRRATDSKAFSDTSLQVHPENQSLFERWFLGEPTLANAFCTERHSFGNGAPGAISPIDGRRCLFHD